MSVVYCTAIYWHCLDNAKMI